MPFADGVVPLGVLPSAANVQTLLPVKTARIANVVASVRIIASSCYGTTTRGGGTGSVFQARARVRRAVLAPLAPKGTSRESEKGPDAIPGAARPPWQEGENQIATCRDCALWRPPYQFHRYERINVAAQCFLRLVRTLFH
jgi:hypothetical protein